MTRCPGGRFVQIALTVAVTAKGEAGGGLERIRLTVNISFQGFEGVQDGSVQVALPILFLQVFSFAYFVFGMSNQRYSA